MSNQSGGSIKLNGGTFAAGGLTQMAGATFEGFGQISMVGTDYEDLEETSGELHLDTGSTMNLIGATSIVGDVLIDAGATLEIRNGQTLITGHTTNNGTIHLIGGTVIFHGGYSGTGTIINEAGNQNNLFDVNQDGIVNIEDFVIFSNNWLWTASWY
ncbi:MAG: hypothetical protein IID32_04835 [Planctomycetes bacterium]|nr:hypothetical protein [Planctomycetota bacterium]